MCPLTGGLSNKILGVNSEKQRLSAGLIVQPAKADGYISAVHLLVID
jgi:hypothetical protein